MATIKSTGEKSEDFRGEMNLNWALQNEYISGKEKHQGTALKSG